MLLFYIAIPIIYLISILPFWLLYRVSDFLYLVIYYGVGYRKKVVALNLKNSFPEKTENELRSIRKKYYRYLCDLTLESLKKITMSREEAIKHCTFHNAELFNRYYSENKSIILLMGHYGNWEWAGSSFTLSTPYQLYVIYKALSNNHFEKLMVKSRTMFGTRLIKAEHTLREIMANRHNLATYAFIADQTPFPEHAYWSTFLHQDTPLFTGAEKLAKKLNFPVVFVNVKRVRRGYYEITPEILFENPKDCKENEITEAYIRRLEKEIIEMPETWLWSHRRWKHKRKTTNQQ